MPTDTFIQNPQQRSRQNISTLTARVRGDLQLRGSNRILDADILNWINEAQDEIARETHWFRTYGLQNQVAGAKEYDLPPACLTIKEVWSETYKRQLKFTTPDDLLAMYTTTPNWAYASRGVPTLYYVRPGSCFGLHPTPLTTINSELFLVYCGLPTLSTLTTDLPFVPTGGESALVAYACWRASLKDANGEGRPRVLAFAQEWQLQLARVKKQIEALADDDIVVFGEFGQTRGRRIGPINDWESGVPIPAPG